VKFELGRCKGAVGPVGLCGVGRIEASGETGAGLCVTTGACSAKGFGGGICLAHAEAETAKTAIKTVRVRFRTPITRVVCSWSNARASVICFDRRIIRQFLLTASRDWNRQVGAQMSKDRSCDGQRQDHHPPLRPQHCEPRRSSQRQSGRRFPTSYCLR